MTEQELDKLEKDAEETAAAFLLLILLKRRDVDLEFRADVGRFYVNGRSVSVTQLREYVSRIEKRTAKRISDDLDALEREQISLAGFQAEFVKNISVAHVLTAALAVGSIAAAVRNEDVIATIESERDYANQFVKDIRTGWAGSPKKIKSRAKSYLLAAAVTFGAMQMKVMGLLGIYRECRRVRRASESCAGCIDWARKGWMPISDMKPLGELQCRWRCRCYIEYR